MSDTEDQEFDESFKGFGDDPTPTTPPVTDPPATPPPAAAEPPKADPEPKPAEEPKKDEEPADPDKEEGTPPADPEKKPEEGAEPPETPETPPEEPKPLTKDDVTSIIRDIRTEERTSGQALEETTKDVLDAYYPDGLSNVLVDQQSGKQLKSPQDVVDVVAATGGEMTIEDAAQWLMNEQYKLDQDVAKIRSDAKQIAETTLKFKQDSVDVLTRYEPIFKAYPQIQGKIWKQYSKLIKADEAKGVVLSAPDMREFYDTVLEPYRLAFEYQSGTPGTAPVASETPPAPAKPGADDRLDEGGDGGTSKPDDPNDFAQQVSKELAKEI